ncbi:unnamed protein product [Haemonchus placei]|uniref:Uncharacterized protein n=1 Tax=Haemonchus placei TaxID=6290 RepID=A0A0N4W5T2_HAEPC|nr:unnamed protein product [Haemonchus placei]
MKRMQEDTGRMARNPIPSAPVKVSVAIEAKPEEERATGADNAEIMEAVHEEEESDEMQPWEGKLEGWKRSLRRLAVA